LSREGEAAARTGDLETATAEFLDAGDRAVEKQMWRTAARYYRGALELDLLAREPVMRLVTIGSRLGNELDWRSYARTLETMPDWPRFGCRVARTIAHDHVTVIACAGAGPVMELRMERIDLVEVHALAPYEQMPLAMALVILRRALWPMARDGTRARGGPRMSVRFGGSELVWLDERGDWARW
jgi:hypothetical protein